MALKYIFFFELGHSGWSETYYRTGNEAIQVQSLDLKKFANARMSLCTDNVTMTGVRISDPTILREAILDTSVSVAAGLETATHHRDVATTAVLCRAFADLRRHNRQIWLRGIPDEFIDFTNSGVFRVKPELNDRLTRFFKMLDGTTREIPNPHFCILQLSDTDPMNAGKKITAVSTHAATGYTVLTAPDLVSADGEAVAIRFVAFSGGFSPRGLNGYFNAYKSASLNLASGQVLIKFKLPSTDLVYLGGGIIKTRRKVLTEIRDVKIVRAASHRTGRPTNVERGRRRALVR